MKISKRTVGTLVKKWKKLLKIESWDVHVVINEEAEENEDAKAYIRVDRSINSATMTVHPSLIDTRKELDMTVAHEMLHVVFSEVDGLLETLGTKLSAVANDAMEGAIDKVVDAIGGII